MNEKENKVLLGDSGLEMFFQEQAERLLQTNPKKETTPPAEYLLSLLQNMKKLLTTLERPWDQYIPIIHCGTLLYTQRIEGASAKMKVAQLSTELITTLSYLDHAGRLIDNMAKYYHQQIHELSKFMEKEAAQEKEKS
ncbi:hypothetical protein [Odoribacter lunatus]|uniref:hypothetical protein n=1 Tax=Odoribacter lunatus TaxID=2941335 RepID=UPI00203E32B7|nr:hypothetical protein [Odoribacter lunatus]